MHYYKETQSDTNAYALSNKNIDVFYIDYRINMLSEITYQFIQLDESITVGLEVICNSLSVKIKLDISILA